MKPADLQHHLFVMSLHGALHLAPIKEGLHNVLDIATGTGIWAIEFGEASGLSQFYSLLPLTYF
jgi:ubiquinone/menaquinone biosynthesis C-methylase UbiE